MWRSLTVQNKVAKLLGCELLTNCILAALILLSKVNKIGKYRLLVQSTINTMIQNTVIKKAQ